MARPITKRVFRMLNMPRGRRHMPSADTGVSWTSKTKERGGCDKIEPCRRNFRSLAVISEHLFDYLRDVLSARRRVSTLSSGHRRGKFEFLSSSCRQQVAEPSERGCAVSSPRFCRRDYTVLLSIPGGARIRAIIDKTSVSNIGALPIKEIVSRYLCGSVLFAILFDNIGAATLRSKTCFAFSKQ